jgi:argininosuccinate lyase
MNKMWGGRFKKKTHPAVEEFTFSIEFDYKLAEYDCIGSLIHATCLGEAGLISRNDQIKLNSALKTILSQIRSHKFRPNPRAEDIHSDIQNKLRDMIGEPALKLQTARSRNDQIVFDMKLYCKLNIEEILKLISQTSEALSEIAMKNREIILPGYTHLQHAQPVKLTDYIGAYRCKLGRDSQRLKEIYNRLRLTLGSGALAGVPIKHSIYKRAARKVAKELKLSLSVDRPANTIDNVSDRDFVVEILSALACLAMHLSRLAEDFILFSSSEFGFLEIGDAFCTGSSLMPQKKNPDCLELIRGNTGRLYGNLISVLTIMKGLPLSYNRDMQLDKEPLFSSVEIIRKELKVLAGLIKTVKFNCKKIEEQLEDESLYATELVFSLIKKGLSFKRAHDIVGRLIRFSQDKDIKIKEMPEATLKSFCKELDPKEIKRLLSPQK